VFLCLRIQKQNQANYKFLGVLKRTGARTPPNEGTKLKYRTRSGASTEAETTEPTLPIRSSSVSTPPAAESTSQQVPPIMAAATPTATAAEEEARLLRLEEQAEHGGGGAWEYLSLARRLRARRPAPVLRLGLALLNDASARSGLASERNAPSSCPSIPLPDPSLPPTRAVRDRFGR
jgi:hypothetical protein